MNQTIKVYLDDERPVPQGWVLVKTAPEAIGLLVQGNVSHLSLDHDLGDQADVGTGYDVLLWLEEKVFTEGLQPPIIAIHTANISARKKMELGLKRLQQEAARQRARKLK